jgi:hypothetical protein
MTSRPCREMGVMSLHVSSWRTGVIQAARANDRFPPIAEIHTGTLPRRTMLFGEKRRCPWAAGSFAILVNSYNSYLKTGCARCAGSRANTRRVEGAMVARGSSALWMAPCPATAGRDWLCGRNDGRLMGIESQALKFVYALQTIN